MPRINRSLIISWQRGILQQEQKNGRGHPQTFVFQPRDLDFVDGRFYLPLRRLNSSGPAKNQLALQLNKRFAAALPHKFRSFTIPFANQEYVIIGPYGNKRGMWGWESPRAEVPTLIKTF